MLPSELWRAVRNFGYQPIKGDSAVMARSIAKIVDERLQKLFNNKYVRHTVHRHEDYGGLIFILHKDTVPYSDVIKATDAIMRELDAEVQNATQ